MTDVSLPTCFIAMPITTRAPEAEEFGDKEHWRHVMEALFIKAIRAAGYREIVPQAKGAWLIHDVIVTNLIEADMVLCDLSSLNSNVFFELGVRTSLNKPIALVYDGRSDLSFDTSGINTYKYKVPLEYWSMEKHVAEMAQHIQDSADSCAGENPLWRQFGLRMTAQQPSTTGNPLDAKLDLLLDRMPEIEQLRRDNALLLRELEHRTLEEARRDFDTLPPSRADGNPGIAAEAINRYAKTNGLSLHASPGLNGLVHVFVPGTMATWHLEKIGEIAAHYGADVLPMRAPGPRDGDQSVFFTPTPEEFMQQIQSDLDEDSS